jgi:hypothetical protein
VSDLSAVTPDEQLSGLRCPFSTDCAWTPGYPDGYRDPPWSGGLDPAGFLPVVRARQDAIVKAFNDHADEAHAELGVQFGWSASE